MRDFEKFLTNVPKPAADVPVFKIRLRDELRSLVGEAERRRDRRRARLALAAAASFALVLALFVVRPGIPAAIRASLTGAEGEVTEERLQRLLTRTELALEEDRRFVDSWTASQERPVSVRQMEGERLVSVRQFELSDGKRMLVFTEIDPEGNRTRRMRTASTAPVF